MKKIIALFAAALIGFGALTTVASAHEQKAGDLVFHHAWARATPAGAKAGAAFVRIENIGDAADQLLSASSDVAAMTEIHQMSMENNTMTMKPAGVLDVPAHGELVLKPHSYHVMLMGLKKPLNEGDTFVVTLTFAKAGKVDLQVVVGKVDDMGEEH